MFKLSTIHWRHLFNITVLVLGTVVAAWAVKAEPLIFIVRHAETIESDSEARGLSELGKARANHLAQLEIANKTAADVLFLATPFERTRQTLAPLAERLGAQVTDYDPRDLQALQQRVENFTGQYIFIAGHSNTINSIAHALSGASPSPVDASDHERIYLVHGDNLFAQFRTQPSSTQFAPEPFPSNLARWSPQILKFQILHNDQNAGHATWRYSDQYRIEEHTLSKETESDALIVADIDSFAPFAASVSMEGQLFGHPLEVSMTFDDDNYSMESIAPRAHYQQQDTIVVKAAPVTQAIERTTAVLSAHLIDCAWSKRGVFRWVNGYDGDVRSIEYECLEASKITTPAGPFSVRRVRYLGGAPSQDFFVTTEPPYRTVAVDVLGTPWRYELVTIEQAAPESIAD